MYGGGYGRPPPQQYGYGQPQYGAPQQYGYPPQQQYGAPPPPQYGQGAYGYGGMPPIAPKAPTGKIEDAIGWVEKAKEYANEFEPGCKAYVDLHLVEQVLRKAKKKVHKASDNLCKEIFDVGGTK